MLEHVLHGFKSSRKRTAQKPIDSASMPVLSALKICLFGLPAYGYDAVSGCEALPGCADDTAETEAGHACKAIYTDNLAHRKLKLLRKIKDGKV